MDGSPSAVSVAATDFNLELGQKAAQDARNAERNAAIVFFAIPLLSIAGAIGAGLIILRALMW